jgi:hypothetical protein
VQLGEAVFDAVMAEQDGQQNHGPQACDGVIVAALAAGRLEAVERLLVGDGLEAMAKGGEGRAVIQFAPGEEGLARMNVHKSPPCK